MTVTQNTEAVAAAQVRVLADALSLGLPVPGHVSFWPACSSLETFTVHFDGRSSSVYDHVRAWARQFDSIVKYRPEPTDEEPSRVHVATDFTVSGVSFKVFGYFNEP